MFSQKKTLLVRIFSQKGNTLKLSVGLLRVGQVFCLSSKILVSVCYGMLVFHGRCVFSFTAVIHLAADLDGRALEGVTEARLLGLRVRIPLRA